VPKDFTGSGLKYGIDLGKRIQPSAASLARIEVTANISHQQIQIKQKIISMEDNIAQAWRLCS